MKRNPIRLAAALAAAVALLGGTAALAGGAKCAEAHTQADYQKMAEKMAKKGYLGLETEKNAAGGYTVKAVAAGSPAAQAGFRAGDVLVALEGVKLGKENKEQIAKVKKGFAPGKQINYTVARQGAETRITATLGEVPREVLAQWLGEHVLDHTSVMVAATN